MTGCTGSADLHGKLSRAHAGVAMQIAEFGVLSQAIVYRRSCLSTGMISAGMPDLGFPRDVRAAQQLYRTAELPAEKARWQRTASSAIR
jgi:hypothetical protein